MECFKSTTDSIQVFSRVLNPLNKLEKTPVPAFNRRQASMARRKTNQIPRYNTVLNIRVDQTLHQETHDLCKTLDLPVSHLARTALREFINRNRSRKSLFEVSPA